MDYAPVGVADLTLLLSDEVLVLVLSHLPARSLLGPVRAVCQRWRRLALDRVCWRGRRIAAGKASEDPYAAAERALQLVPCLGALRLRLTRLTPLSTLRAAAATSCRIAEVEVVIRGWADGPSVLAALRRLTRDAKRLIADFSDSLSARLHDWLLRVMLGGQRLTHLRLRCPIYFEDMEDVGEDFLQDIPVAGAVRSLELVETHPFLAIRVLRLFAASLQSVSLLGLTSNEALKIAPQLRECRELTALALGSCANWVFIVLPLDYFDSEDAARLKTLRLETDAVKLRAKKHGLIFTEPAQLNVYQMSLRSVEALASQPSSALEELAISYCGFTDDYTQRLVSALVSFNSLVTMELGEESDALDWPFADAMVAAPPSSLRAIDLRASWKSQCSRGRCCVPVYRRLVRGCGGLHIVGVRLTHRCRDGPLDSCPCCREHPASDRVVAEVPAAVLPRLASQIPESYARPGRFGFYAHPPEEDCHTCRKYQGAVLWIWLGGH